MLARLGVDMVAFDVSPHDGREDDGREDDGRTHGDLPCVRAVRRTSWAWQGLAREEAHTEGGSARAACSPKISTRRGCCTRRSSLMPSLHTSGAQSEARVGLAETGARGGRCASAGSLRGRAHLNDLRGVRHAARRAKASPPWVQRQRQRSHQRKHSLALIAIERGIAVSAGNTESGLVGIAPVIADLLL